LVVVIFRPVGTLTVASPFTAAKALRVRSLHVTVTGPAARVVLAANVIAIALEPYTDVVAVAGEVMVHLLATAAVTRSAGNARLIFSVAAKAVEVVNETEAVPLAATMSVLIFKADAATAVTNPTAGTSTKAAIVSLDV